MNLDRYKAKEGQKVDLKKYTTDCDADLDKEKVKKRTFSKRYQGNAGTPGKIICREYVWCAYCSPGHGCGWERRNR